MTDLATELAAILKYKRAPRRAGGPTSIGQYEIPKGLLALLDVADGFITEGRVFRVFGTVGDAKVPSLEQWNQSGWLEAYETDDMLIVGEDIFGDQYGYRFDGAKKEFVRMRCEGGAIEPIVGGINGFITALLEPAHLVDMALVEQARTRKLRPSHDEHLAFKLPLITGGDANIENLAVESAALHMGTLCQLVEQIGLDR